MPIKINGATSGSTTITAPATGGDESIELSTALASKLDLAGGKILQIVRATDTTARSTTSTSAVDVTGMSITITPQKSDSQIVVMACGYIYANWSTGDAGIGYLFITDSSNNVIQGGERVGYGTFNITGTGTRETHAGFTLIARATPATTSPVTYKLRFASDTANVTTTVRNNVCAGQVYALEISA